MSPVNESGKAVFLSYASQDAVAAKRICDALRQAGIEVWFDQSELRGGDAWDQKIRRQIRECALFMPIVSPNTNSRPEGYFRLEWKLAVDRSHLLADDHPFLFPVAIGDLSDASARVPDKFRDVQWTRLRLDETPTELAARVGRLLSGDPAEAERPRPATRGSDFAKASTDREGTAPPRERTRRPAWLRYAWAAVGITFALVYALRPMWRAARPMESKPVIPAAPTPLTEARRLVQQARALIDDDSLAVRENFLTAKRLGERAVELDPGDAEAYAVTARASCQLIAEYRDSSPANLAAARSRAESAIRLAPDSVEAALALAAVDLVTKSRPAEVERRLAALLPRVPDDRRVFQLLEGAALSQNHVDEAQKWVDQAIALPGGDPESLNRRAGIFWGRNDYGQMAKTLEQSLAQRPTAVACHFKLMLLVWGWGDLPAGRAWVEQMPASLLQEDRVAMLAFLTWYWSRQPDRALEVLQRFPRPFIEQGALFVSVNYLAGCAQLLAGHPEAARVEFTTGLKAINDRLAQEPSNPRYLHEKVVLLARLGQRAEAGQSLRVLRELLGPNDPTSVRPEVLVLTGSTDEALAAAEHAIDRSRSRWPIRANELRYDPVYDPLRADPRFLALVARGEAQLAELRTGGGPAAEPGADQPAAAKADDKSVAVLAFTNLSDDKENEYFSDGISEELLNVLAKVPKLKVAARTSSFYFKGRDAPISEIAQKLGVAYVVEGSVRKAGNKVRITAQLIKAADGFHVWSETYDRELQDVFAVQDEIAKNILGVVKGSLLGEAELPHATTTKIEAYTLFLQAQGAFSRRGEAGLREAIRLFEGALAIDPDYVPALAGLAQARVVLPNYAYMSGAKEQATTDAALKAARHVLELDPENAVAFAVIGWAKFQFEWRWAESETALRRARDLAPNDSWTWNCLGDYYRFVGDLPQALAAKQREWDLDPLSPNSHWDLSYLYLVAGRYDEAIHWSDLCVAMAPHNMDSYMPGILAAGRAGRLDLMRQNLAAARANVHEGEGMMLLVAANCAILEKETAEARRLLALAEPLAETASASPGYLGYCYLLLGDGDRAAAWLQRGYDRADPSMVWNEVVDFDVVASNPKTRQILEQPKLKELYELRQHNARSGANKL